MIFPAAAQKQTRRGSQSGCRSFAMPVFLGHALACPLFLIIFILSILLVRILAGLI